MHIAIISLGYPPVRHVSGTRAGRMAIELAAMGHDITVITIDWRAFDGPRPSPSTEAGVYVVRIDPREWFPDFDPGYRPLRLDVEPRVALFRRARTAARMFRWGPFAHWARRGYTALLKRHEAHPIDVVWAIHGDDSAHEIAFRFHRRTGVAWVADWDPWDQFHPRSVRHLQYFLTLRRLRTAAAMTSTVAEQAREDERDFGLPATVIWTSYAHELLAAAQPKRASECFTLLYLGHFGEKHDLGALARTLRLVRERSERRVEFHVFGHASDLLRPWLEKEGAEDLLIPHGFVAQNEAYSLMRGADVLILVPTANHTVGVAVGVKELEYFASGSPVITVGPLLDEMRTVTTMLPSVVECATPQRAAEAILEELRHFGTGTPSPHRAEVNPPALMAHTWPAKAQLLATTLARAAHSPRR